MNIVITAGKDVMNQWVDVTITAASPQRVAHVRTELDSFPIGDDDLNPPEDVYDRTWNQVGLAGPNETHKVVVIATDQKGNKESASKIWQD